MTVLQGDRFWPNICRAIEREDLTEDSRFSLIEPRRENSAAMVAIFDIEFRKRTLG